MSDISLKWSKYITQVPTAKQLAFLLLPHREALFGGAAGGGKSSAVLMAALQYVDVPGYAAIIFRKTLADLKQPNALLDRAHTWLGNSDAKWVASEHTYYFPTRDHRGKESTPSKLVFGYIGETNAYLRYQGIEVQYVAFDELTQHEETDYVYLFSRLRKTICPLHKTETGAPDYNPDCPLCGQAQGVPIRMRATTNPGGPGMNWVKNRFRIESEEDEIQAAKKGARVVFQGKHPRRPFVPSFVADNPHLDQSAYYKGLDELDPVTREQLKYGDWGVRPDARFKADWVRYFSRRGDYFTLGMDGTGQNVHIRDLLRIFCTVDPAASSREGPADANSNQKTSWTVISTWALTADYHLLWLDMVRFRAEIPDVVKKIKEVYRAWKPAYMIIEANGAGRGVVQYSARMGIPIRSLNKHRDKVSNSTTAQVRMADGRIWLPQAAPWRKIVEGELLTWTGADSEPDDIVDTLSDAANDVGWDAAYFERSALKAEGMKWSEPGMIDTNAGFNMGWPDVSGLSHPGKNWGF